MSPAAEFAVHHHMRAGRLALAWETAGVDVTFDFERLPRGIDPPARTTFARALSEVDPRLVLRNFPRKDDGSGTPCDTSVPILSAPLTVGKRATWEEDHAPVELWLRLRHINGQFLLHLAAHSARMDAQRWDEFPWKFSRQYQDVDDILRFGSSLVWERAAHAPEWLRQKEHERKQGQLLAEDVATVAVLLLDDERIEDALRVCDVEMTPSMEALLSDDIARLFLLRLQTIFPHANASAFVDDANALARPRRGLCENARRALRQSAPWNFARTFEQMRADYLGDSDFVPLVPLDALFPNFESNAENIVPVATARAVDAVWLVLREGGVLDVVIAAPIPCVAPTLAWQRSLSFECKRLSIEGDDHLPRDIKRSPTNFATASNEEDT